ncbi:hypothetical protein [Peribacillus frigoritolerans]|uniref:hypothetical protein n=1 Tax=Peribacillus frigoritolerans TaxID=450367 RepID=UPI00207A6EDB|nr:hypothetical protein [Peribacillus frigoritolerans]USK77779.1 hypothetical protein LIT31_25985 [Peribacillus frigoritolerans]
MAKKVQKNLKLDAGILAEFEKIANRKKEHHNTEIEEMMKQYIARDGQMLFDDLYAPRIAYSVEKAVDKQVNRLAKMIYQTQVDATAGLYSSPVFHIEMLKGVEEIMESYFDHRVLNPNRPKVSNKFTFNENGKKAVANLRKMANVDHQEKRKAKAMEGMQA